MHLHPKLKAKHTYKPLKASRTLVLQTRVQSKQKRMESNILIGGDGNDMTAMGKLRGNYMESEVPHEIMWIHGTF